MREYSQREIADFLGVPVTTVNARLAAARTALRNRILGLVRDALRDGALPQDFPQRVVGRIDDWRRTRDPKSFGAWPGPTPMAPVTRAPHGFSPDPDPNRCGCRTMAWPCPRCARLEGVDPTPPAALGAT